MFNRKQIELEMEAQKSDVKSLRAMVYELQDRFQILLDHLQLKLEKQPATEKIIPKPKHMQSYSEMLDQIIRDHRAAEQKQTGPTP
jgi:hypothetical protein